MRELSDADVRDLRLKFLSQPHDAHRVQAPARGKQTKLMARRGGERRSTAASSSAWTAICRLGDQASVIRMHAIASYLAQWMAFQCRIAFESTQNTFQRSLRIQRSRIRPSKAWVRRHLCWPCAPWLAASSKESCEEVASYRKKYRTSSQETWPRSAE